jgi:hypothetical protein
MPFQTLVVEYINKWDFDRRLVVPFGSWREQQWSKRLKDKTASKNLHPKNKHPK